MQAAQYSYKRSSGQYSYKTRRQQYAAIERFRTWLDLDSAIKHTAYLAEVDPVELAVAHFRREIGRYERRAV